MRSSHAEINPEIRTSLLAVARLLTCVVLVMTFAGSLFGAPPESSVVPVPPGPPAPNPETGAITAAGDMLELFDFDGLLSTILTTPFSGWRPVIVPATPPVVGTGFQGDPDGIPYATVVRATIDGARFKGYFRGSLNRAPNFCDDPMGPPIELSSRITLEIWIPDPIDFSDLDSAVVLVIKSGLPDDAELTSPQKMANRLVQEGVCTVVWWERDDNPADSTPYQDVVVASRNGDSFGVLLGDGSGELGPPRRTGLPNGAAPHAILAEDFNADGHLDLALTFDGLDTVQISFGDGFGTFENEISLATGLFPRALASGHLNPDSDAFADLVVANRNSDDVHVFFGAGDGSFSAPTVLPVGVQPSSIVVGDFDGDDDVDLAVACGGDDSVTVLFGDDLGNFGSPVTAATGDNPFAMTGGYVNGDAHLDLVTANRNGDDASVLLGNGDGTFAAPITVSGPGTQPSAVVAGFFDGDGDLDLAIANGGTDDVTVHLGNGDGTFAAATSIAAGVFPNGMISADLNQDLVVDLVVANRDSSDVSVLLGDGLGGFVAGGSFVVDAGPVGLAAGNVTNSTWKTAYQFGYSGDGALQKAGFGWMVHRHLNQAPEEALTNEELRFDFRFVYAQAYLAATTFFLEYLRDQYPAHPDLEAWIDGIKIAYAGGSKRGGGITTAVLESNILASIDPRNVVGLFISGYQGLDAGELGGFHRYETDWSHELEPELIAELRDNPCPEPSCVHKCPAPKDCEQDSGEHPFKDFAIWAHRTLQRAAVLRQRLHAGAERRQRGAARRRAGDQCRGNA